MGIKFQGFWVWSVIKEYGHQVSGLLGLKFKDAGVRCGVWD